MGETNLVLADAGLNQKSMLTSSVQDCPQRPEQGMTRDSKHGERRDMGSRHSRSQHVHFPGFESKQLTCKKGHWLITCILRSTMEFHGNGSTSWDLHRAPDIRVL